MWSDGLTKRQAEILEMINDCVTRNGFAPSIREIADAFQISSPNGVVCHLKALEKKGFLSRRKTKSRAIELSQQYLQQVRGIPVKGEIATGKIHASDQASRRVDLGQLFDPEQCYVLEVKGDSLAGENMRDGDQVVVQPSKEADSGQLAVIRSESGEIAIQRWEEMNGSGQHMTATLPALEVLGVVVGVVRTQV